MIELNKIYCMDCLEGMKQLPGGFVDCIITDPPYGLGSQNITNNKSRGSLAKAKDWADNGEWDNKIPSEEYFREMFRISKNQIIFGGNYMTCYLKPSSCWIVWDKDNGDNDFADCELAWTSFNKAVRKFKYRWNGMLQERMNWKEERVHPTQKPIALGRWLLQKFTKENELILDPFVGSGSFLIACKQLNRNFIGFELSQQYVDIANERLCQSNLLNLLLPQSKSI
jgi:site-specific DNA-methyltransferase (adenine-specific)